MSIATTQTPLAPVISWTNKAGKAFNAFSATQAARAPLAARVADAVARDVSALLNGTYRPVLRGIAASLTDKDVKALVTTASGFSMLPVGKDATLVTLGAIGAYLKEKGDIATANGKKLPAKQADAIAVIDGFMVALAQREADKADAARTVDAGAADTMATAQSMVDAGMADDTTSDNTADSAVMAD